MAEGRIERIWIKRAKRGPMDPVESATLIEDSGVEGSADQGGWRQVTIIEREVFDRIRDELGDAVDPAMRRANVMVSGVPLDGSRGRVLRLGDTRIQLRGETVPCGLMDEQLPGLRAALQPDTGGGMFGKIIAGGTIRVGESAVLEEE